MEDRNTHPQDAAYPMNIEYLGEVDGVPSMNTKTCFGLTKREHFAGLAMQGLLAQMPERTSSSKIAKEAVMCADKLIEALNK